jgi:hypothetical protein
LTSVGRTDTVPGGTSTKSRRRRRWPLLLSATALGLAAVVVTGLFWWNTESLTLEAEADQMAPGGTATIAIGMGDFGCGPSFEHLYRRTLVGRWQLTHTSDDGQQWARHNRGLLSVGSWKEFSPLPCGVTGSAEIVIPRDVTWSPVVACSHDDDNCVRIDIDHEG